MKLDLFLFNIRTLIFLFPLFYIAELPNEVLMYFSLLDRWGYTTVEAVRSGAVGKNVFGSGMTRDSLGLISFPVFSFSFLQS